MKRRLRRTFGSGEKGFTLIELLIVIFVLGALAAVVVPSVASFLTTANLTAANTEALNVKTATIFVLATTGEFPGSSNELYGGAVNYLSGKSDGTYTFDPTTGLISSATAGEGVTKGLGWDKDKQSWYRP